MASCSICGVLLFVLSGSSDNMICNGCRDGAKILITLSNKIENYNGLGIKHIVPSRGFANALKWMHKLEKADEKLNEEKLRFLGGFVSAFKEPIHADIMVRPGSNGPSIPAHKAVLTTRSQILKNMLDSDKCKAPPEDDTITIEELNYEQLEAFLEFLYTGDLPKSKMEKHVYSLYIAADKYEIPFLQTICKHQMLGSISPSNVLDILERADSCSDQALKENAISFIVKNLKEVVFLPRFEVLVSQNPHLTVQIARASFGGIKKQGTNVKEIRP